MPIKFDSQRNSCRKPDGATCSDAGTRRGGVVANMDWVTTCMVMEEVGTLGYIFSCVFGIGAELVCDAIMLHGTDEQKGRVKPLLKGELFAAECLTEPRGGSDFLRHYEFSGR